MWNYQGTTLRVQETKLYSGGLEIAWQGTPSALPTAHPLQHLQKFSLNRHDTETELMRQEQALYLPAQISVKSPSGASASCDSLHKTSSFQILAQVLNASQPFNKQGLHQHSGRMYENNVGSSQARQTDIWASPELKRTQHYYGGKSSD